MASLSIKSTYTLNSGYEIPILGLGVYQTPPDVTEDVVTTALSLGYRHVDSAQIYRNEGPSAAGFKKSGINRSDFFFTTKVGRSNMGYEKAKASIDKSLQEVGLEYFDLILIHCPFGGKEAREGTWKALVEAQKQGKTRSIGISNYGVHHLDELEAYIQREAGGKIDVGQYEIHPWLTRQDIVQWLQKRNIIVEAYSPLVQAQKMDDPILCKVAEVCKKTPAQVLVRWSLQKGYVPLPKSVKESRIQENQSVFDFEIPQNLMDELTTDEYMHVCWDPTVWKD